MIFNAIIGIFSLSFCNMRWQLEQSLLECRLVERQAEMRAALLVRFTTFESFDFDA